MFGKAEVVGKHSAEAQAQRAANEASNRTSGGDATLLKPAVEMPRHASSAEPSQGKTHRVGKIIAIICAVIGALLLVCYLVGVALFARVFFLPATSVNSENVSLRPMGEVASEHTESAGSYKLAVTGQGIDLTIPATNIDLTLDGNAYVDSVMSQINTWAWPALVFSSRDLRVDVVASYDETKVTKLVGSTVESLNANATPPVNAEVAFVSESGRYEVIGGAPGTELNVAAVTNAVAAALTSLQTSVSITEEHLVQPEIKADDATLVAQAAELNKYVGATQTLTVADNTVRVVDGNQIIQWVSYNPDGSATVNSEAVTAWAQGELSEELDSVGSTRNYIRPDGKEVQVGGGTYGWSIDGAELATQMIANISAGTPATIEIPMLQTAVSFNPGAADWGSRYVDIDLSEQYVRLYDDAGALIWESSCVSGKTSDGHGTPTGVYYMNDYRATGNVELRGKIDPKTNQPEYISYVTYWMPFIDNAVALHDASWRGSFGGSIYQYNGSHGCVNLPTDAAASLFNLVAVGDVVVVHY